MPPIAKPFVTNADDSPAYWQIGNLWRVMATGVQTDNSFTLLDQIVHSGGGGGPVTHTHTQDEGLYVISGECKFNAGGHQGLPGTPGTFVAIPGNTEHSFSVEKPDTQILNFYLPAGFEQLLIGISHPAEKRQPPPPELVQEMLPPRELSAKLARDYGQDNVLGDPFTDPPDPNKMATRPTPGATVFPFTANVQDAGVKSYCVKSGLWTLLASGAQTGGSYSLIEQRLRRGPLFSPHMFVDRDVVYYIFGGELSFLLGDRVERAKSGALVFVPRGYVHAVMVQSKEAHVLVLHTPGGFERYVEVVGMETEERTLPKESVPDKEVEQGVRARVMEKLGMRMVAVENPLV